MNKNYILLFILSFIITQGVFAQHFEGYILYKYQFLDLEGNDITEKMGPTMGFEQHYYINAQNYKGYNEKGKLAQLYHSASNMYYFEYGGQLQSMNASTPFPTKFYAEPQEETETILDMKCTSVLTTSELGETTYFFNEDIRANPEAFQNHKFGNWSNYLNHTKGALPLKYISKNTQYIMISTAVEIRKEEIGNDKFELETALKARE